MSLRIFRPPDWIKPGKEKILQIKLCWCYKFLTHLLFLLELTEKKKDAMMGCKIIRNGSNIFVQICFPNKIFKVTLYFYIRGMLSHRRLEAGMAGVFVKSRKTSFSEQGTNVSVNPVKPCAKCWLGGFEVKVHIPQAECGRVLEWLWCTKTPRVKGMAAVRTCVSILQNSGAVSGRCGNAFCQRLLPRTVYISKVRRCKEKCWGISYL